MAAAQAKEKGNVAFKTGQYAEAIGHYSAAILADRTNPTLPLNRAAAYLKLEKWKDAERDCSTVLSLDSKSVKALFRRGQARAGLRDFDGSKSDLDSALKIEPNNAAIKAELSKLSKLGTSNPQPSSSNQTMSPPQPLRRRVPITIVEDTPSNKPPTSSQPQSNDTMTVVSSRKLSKTLEDVATSTPATGTPRSTPGTFEQAREAREARIKQSSTRPRGGGGGVFRASGAHNVFKPKTEPDVTMRDSSDEPTVNRRPPIKDATKPPFTLFEFTRQWDALATRADRWRLFRQIPPTALPALYQSSLEPHHIVSVLPLFTLEEVPVGMARTYMQAYESVPRFKTVLLFLTEEEKLLVDEVCDRLGGERGAWAIV